MQTCAKQTNQVPFRESRLRYVPGGSFLPVATQINGGEIIEERGCIGGFPFVISPPGSTSRADERTAGEEIGRGAASKAAPSRRSPAHVAEEAGQTDARTSSQRSRNYCDVAIVFPAELTTRDGRTRRGPKPCTRASLAEPPVLFFRRERPSSRRNYQRRQKNMTGCHVGSAASVNSLGGLVAGQGTTPTGSEHSNQAPPRGRGL